MGVPGRELSLFDQARIRRWLVDRPPRSVRWMAMMLGVARSTVRKYKQRMTTLKEGSDDDGLHSAGILAADGERDGERGDDG